MDNLPAHLAIARDLTLAWIETYRCNSEEATRAFALFAYIAQICESDPPKGLAEGQ